MASQQPLDASHLLPLTDLAFNILVALTDRELHGYALIKELRIATLVFGIVPALQSLRLESRGSIGTAFLRPGPTE
ncbi:MAG: hypothetical protein VX956_05940 [Gemmatimonadota bacterium]|jgi:hypothetical protein|nr:hypothetical protein [Gemmatimonadota bacterium]|tara:strand:+ start:16543 stop:16770 length:228 start_codon:yes stop_codon:yes gene_type:complete